MTKDEILQRVKEHFQEGGIRDDGSCAEYFLSDEGTEHLKKMNKFFSVEKPNEN